MVFDISSRHVEREYSFCGGMGPNCNVRYPLVQRAQGKKFENGGRSLPRNQRKFMKSVCRNL